MGIEKILDAKPYLDSMDFSKFPFGIFFSHQDNKNTNKIQQLNREGSRPDFGNENEGGQKEEMMKTITNKCWKGDPEDRPLIGDIIKNVGSS